MAFGDLISTSNFMEKDVLYVKTSAPLIFTMELLATSVLLQIFWKYPHALSFFLPLFFFHSFDALGIIYWMTKISLTMYYLTGK